MRTFLKTVVRALEAGQDVELVTVLAASGSTPRGAGAMLAVFPDGASTGTVGGGSVEYEATRLAGDLLRTHRNALREFSFVQGEAASLGMVCGGGVTLHFQYLSASDRATLSLLQKLREATGENRDVWLVRRLDGAEVSAMFLANRQETSPELPSTLLGPKSVFRDGWFVLPAVRAGLTYIFGGGHVSQALVPAVAAVGFRPVVCDDRTEFADRSLFPRAAEVRLVDFGNLSALTITPDDYVVIMTRGHQADYEVLSQTLRSGAKYIGCIGSKKKLALCRERLLSAGFTAAEYARVHAPIGLAIGAETPAEIAVSVAAELIAVRAGVLP